jgi:hypothetical protein
MAMRLCSLIATIGFAIAGCSETGRIAVSGNVTIDNKPVDRGMITFQSVNNPSKPTGGSVANGKFDIDKSHGLLPGDHKITLQAQRRTGKKVHDRQMPTEIEQTVIVNLKPDTMTAHVSEDNAQHLEFNFNEAR